MQKGPDAMTADCCLCVSQKVAFSEGNQKQTYKLQLYDKAAFSPHPLSQIYPLPIENISGKKMQMALIKNWRGESSLTDGLPAGSTSSVVHRRSGEQKQDVKMYKQQKTYI